MFRKNIEELKLEIPLELSENKLIKAELEVIDQHYHFLEKIINKYNIEIAKESLLKLDKMIQQIILRYKEKLLDNTKNFRDDLLVKIKEIYKIVHASHQALPLKKDEVWYIRAGVASSFDYSIQIHSLELKIENAEQELMYLREKITDFGSAAYFFSKAPKELQQRKIEKKQEIERMRKSLQQNTQGPELSQYMQLISDHEKTVGEQLKLEKKNSARKNDEPIASTALNKISLRSNDLFKALVSLFERYQKAYAHLPCYIEQHKIIDFLQASLNHLESLSDASKAAISAQMAGLLESPAFCTRLLVGDGAESDFKKSREFVGKIFSGKNSDNSPAFNHPKLKLDLMSILRNGDTNPFLTSRQKNQMKGLQQVCYQAAAPYWTELTAHLKHLLSKQNFDERKESHGPIRTIGGLVNTDIQLMKNRIFLYLVPVIFSTPKPDFVDDETLAMLVLFYPTIMHRFFQETNAFENLFLAKGILSHHILDLAISIKEKMNNEIFSGLSSQELTMLWRRVTEEFILIEDAYNNFRASRMAVTVRTDDSSDLSLLTLATPTLEPELLGEAALPAPGKSMHG
jgi:hypothetical protein